jgi:UDP-3-O-[3-hydroxymyristoyl] glucosamine N-acyltransferase
VVKSGLPATSRLARAFESRRAEVWGNIESDATVSGSPARPRRETLKAQAYLRRLPELYRRLEAIEKRIATT